MPWTRREVREKGMEWEWRDRKEHGEGNGDRVIDRIEMDRGIDRQMNRQINRNVNKIKFKKTDANLASRLAISHRHRFFEDPDSLTDNKDTTYLKPHDTMNSIK